MKNAFILKAGTWFLLVRTPPSAPPSNSEWNEEKKQPHVLRINMVFSNRSACEMGWVIYAFTSYIIIMHIALMA